MSLSSALNSAQSGLTATSFRANVAANNIANASTPGYVNRVAVTTENVVGNRTNGVAVSGTERQQDAALSGLKREALGSAGRADILASAYNQLNDSVGLPDSDFGLFADLQTFDSALRDLAGTPESSALQTSVFQSGLTLINQFAELSQTAQNMRETADGNIASAVETVNLSLTRLQEINREVIGLDQDRGEADSLLDERQMLLDSISEIIPIKENVDDNGQLEVTTREGAYLLAGSSVYALEFTPANAIPANVRYDDGSNILSGLTVNGQNVTPGGGNFAIVSGSLAGYFSQRDDIVPTFSDQIDSLAADLVSRFADDTLDPTKTPGAPGLFTDGGGVVDPTNIAGIAGRLTLNAAVDPAQGGDISRLRDGLGATTSGPSGNADILNNLIDALEQTNAAPDSSGVVGNVSFSDLIAEFSSTVGEARVRHDALQASTTTRSQALSDAEIQQTGVDIDQELQSLLTIEQAYAANARVMQTVGDMLDRLMQI